MHYWVRHSFPLGAQRWGAKPLGALLATLSTDSLSLTVLRAPEACELMSGKEGVCISHTGEGHRPPAPTPSLRRGCLG